MIFNSFFNPGRNLKKWIDCRESWSFAWRGRLFTAGLTGASMGVTIMASLRGFMARNSESVEDAVGSSLEREAEREFEEGKLIAKECVFPWTIGSC
jgi:hypothetical protein